MSFASVHKFRHDLAALEATVTRAGQALGCKYASSDEFEAEVVRLRRAGRGYELPGFTLLRVVLGAVSTMSLVTLFLLTL
jgi:hypothetical protein